MEGRRLTLRNVDIVTCDFVTLRRFLFNRHSEITKFRQIKNPMELILKRIAKRKTYTIGKLYIDGEPFCDTLEPTWRDYANGAYKMKGKSAIPDGSYAVVISYSPKFQEWLPLLLGGPEFNRKWQGVRIHAGNSAKDTEGCILVGENREVGRVLDSRRTLARLMKRLAERPEGEAVRLRIES